MFRQVIAYRWADGVTDDAKAAFRAALDGLRVIPELSSLQFATTEVTTAHPSASIKLVLRQDPRRAQALAGFDAIAFTVATIEDLDALVAHLDAPSAPSSAMCVDVADPDGFVVRLTTLLP